MALILVGLLVLGGLGAGTVLLLRQTTGGVDLSAFQTVSGPALTYAVPPDWTVAPPVSAPPGPDGGVPFTGLADGPRYTCGGKNFVRGVAGTLLVPGAQDPAALAASVAAEFAADGYSTEAPAEVTLAPATSVDVAGTPGTLVEATVRAVSTDGCLASDGVVLALAVPLPDGTGTAVLVVNGDIAGGPAEPPSPDRAAIDAIIASAQPTGI